MKSQLKKGAELQPDNCLHITCYHVSTRPRVGAVASMQSYRRRRTSRRGGEARGNRPIALKTELVDLKLFHHY